MGQILHKCAKTTERIRVEIQQSKESIQKIAKRYNVNPKTVIKWRSRDSVSDMKMGTKSINTVLTETEEAMALSLRLCKLQTYLLNSTFKFDHKMRHSFIPISNRLRPFFSNITNS